jgi:hypothetical protein
MGRVSISLITLITSILCSLAGVALSALPAAAQVYGPHVGEFQFKIEARFLSGTARKALNEIQAQKQLDHIFGLFQSPSVVEGFGLDPEKVGGIGAIQYPADFEILKTQKVARDLYTITYAAHGKVLLHKAVAEAVLAGRELKLPLPVQLDAFYDRACTDRHYPEFGDFWYFFDPYRKGCDHLAKPPLAEEFELDVTPSTRRELDMDLRLDLLRGANGNGETLRIDVIHGYEESAGHPRDYGRKTFEAFHRYLRAAGYDETVLKAYANRPLLRYTKEIELAGGKKITAEINSILVETGADSKTVTFAKFFRDAVENADVVYYAGHSGLGGNLNIGNLENKAGGFRFNATKRQIFYFDSCSSYSYYLESFRAEKSRARLDIVTNGLSSYFETGLDGLVVFLEQILDPEVEDRNWTEVLGAVEATLDGSTYLVNVGGI